MKKMLFVFLFLCALSAPPALAVETAPRISDREIIEKLTRLDEKFNRLEEGQKSLNKRFDDVNRRIDDLRSDMNKRFETLTWMLGLFISIATIILAFLLRILWIMQKRQAEMETSLKNQKEEFVFLKNLIEKLLPPKGVL